LVQHAFSLDVEKRPFSLIANSFGAAARCRCPPRFNAAAPRRILHGIGWEIIGTKHCCPFHRPVSILGQLERSPRPEALTDIDELPGKASGNFLDSLF
jgi:hypothetical protein